jgi:hypothetical protein
VRGWPLTSNANSDIFDLAYSLIESDGNHYGRAGKERERAGNFADAAENCVSQRIKVQRWNRIDGV